MPAADSGVAALAEAVADGSEIDWDRAESSANGPEERQIVTHLKMLADVATAARSQTTQWGPLEIRERVGNGTFGTVCRAWDRRLDREVALKLLRRRHPSGSAVIHEGRLLARIRHPNVVTVFGADIFDEQVGIWMEFVHGRTLKEILQEHGRFGAHEATLIGRDLCRALAAVHREGFLHRDVKAQNVMRETGGRVVLMDFGAGDVVAQCDRRHGQLAGTPLYLAPEVLQGTSPSVGSDLYSLGVLLYHLVSGEFPVVGSSLDDLRTRHEQRPAKLLRDTRPDLPAEFVRAVDAAIAPDPGERPASAGAFERLLDRALAPGQGGEKATLPDNAPPRPSLWTRASSGVFRRAIAAALLVIAGLGMSRIYARWASPPIPRRDSVAILLFTSESDARDAEYLGAGVTQDVVAHLRALRGLRIIAGNSTLVYRGRARSPVEIGRELDVATVLEGSVQRVGDRLRIVSRLVDAVNGDQLWSDSVERNVEDIFAMQSEISRKIALALRGELSRSDSERLRPALHGDFEAFSLYLRGRSQWALRTQDGINHAIQLFEESLSRDGRYAPPYVGLSDAYTSLGVYGMLPRSEAFRRAALAAEKAVELDPALAEAHASLAYARKNRFEWTAAEESFKRAIELQPGYGAAHHWYSIYLTQRGRFPEAITEIKTAIALDPLSIGANLQFGTLLMMARRYEDAIAQWQHALQMDEGIVNAHRGIATSYAYLGLFGKAIDAADRAAAKSPLAAEDQELKTDRAYVFALAGRSDEARREIAVLIERNQRTGERLEGSIAAIHAGLRDVESSFTWLTRARDLRDPEVGFLKVDPRWDPLRADPRFARLLESLGLN